MSDYGLGLEIFMDVLQVVRDRIRKKYKKKNEENEKGEKKEEKKAEAVPYMCTLCRLTFSSEAQLKKHHKDYHTMRFGQ